MKETREQPLMDTNKHEFFPRRIMGSLLDLFLPFPLVLMGVHSWFN